MLPQEKSGKTRAAGEQAVREAIADLPQNDRILAEGMHCIVSEVAPQPRPEDQPRSVRADGRANAEEHAVQLRENNSDPDETA